MPFDFSAAPLVDTEVERRVTIDAGTACTAWILGIVLPWAIILFSIHWLFHEL